MSRARTRRDPAKPRPNRRRAFLFGVGGFAATAAGLHLLGAPARMGPLFIRRRGTHGPRLLCLHGLFGSGAFWTRLADHLEPHFRLTIPDLIGFGHSPQPEADYTLDFHLRHLEPLLAEGSDWVVMGHSMGCVLAAELARSRPDAVKAVLLFNAPVYSSPAHRREIFGKQNLLTRLSMSSPRAARAVCEATVCLPRPILTRIAPWLRADVPPESASDYFRHTFNSYHTSLNHLVLDRDLMATLAALRPPTLVVQGSRDTLVDAPAMLRWPANVRLEVLEGTDHTSLLLHEPHRAATIVRGFVRQAASTPAAAPAA
jgi:pimeloyl-ACP methyl ester carboxylesterase